MRPIDVFAHWKQVRTELIETIEKFEPEELTFTPFPGSWPAGRIMLHIADAEDGWLRRVITQELDAWPDWYTLDNYPDKESIVGALNEVHERTLAYLDSLELADLPVKIQTPAGPEISRYWIIWHVLEHEIHHRGELSLMLGMLGREGLDV